MQQMRGSQISTNLRKEAAEANGVHQTQHNAWNLTRLKWDLWRQSVIAIRGNLGELLQWYNNEATPLPQTTMMGAWQMRCGNNLFLWAKRLYPMTVQYTIFPRLQPGSRIKTGSTYPSKLKDLTDLTPDWPWVIMDHEIN